MTWTYDTSLSTDKDKVRLYIGDTDTNSQLLSNEEITAILAIWTDPLDAAAQLAESLSARYARRSSVRIGNFTKSGGEASKQFADLAARLRASRGSKPGALGTPFVGGVSKQAMEDVEADADRTESKFKIGGMDNPANTGPDPASRET